MKLHRKKLHRATHVPIYTQMKAGLKDEEERIDEV